MSPVSAQCNNKFSSKNNIEHSSTILNMIRHMTFLHIVGVVAEHNNRQQHHKYLCLFTLFKKLNQFVFNSCQKHGILLKLKFVKCKKRNTLIGQIIKFFIIHEALTFDYAFRCWRKTIKCTTIKLIEFIFTLVDYAYNTIVFRHLKK